METWDRDLGLRDLGPAGGGGGQDDDAHKGQKPCTGCTCSVCSDTGRQTAPLERQTDTRTVILSPPPQSTRPSWGNLVPQPGGGGGSSTSGRSGYQGRAWPSLRILQTALPPALPLWGHSPQGPSVTPGQCLSPRPSCHSFSRPSSPGSYSRHALLRDSRAPPVLPRTEVATAFSPSSVSPESWLRSTRWKWLSGSPCRLGQACPPLQSPQQDTRSCGQTPRSWGKVQTLPLQALGCPLCSQPTLDPKSLLWGGKVRVLGEPRLKSPWLAVITRTGSLTSLGLRRLRRQRIYSYQPKSLAGEIGPGRQTIRPEPGGQGGGSARERGILSSRLPSLARLCSFSFPH